MHRVPAILEEEETRGSIGMTRVVKSPERLCQCVNNPGKTQRRRWKMHILRMETVCIKSFHHRVQDLISFYVWVKLLLFLPTTQAASGAPGAKYKVHIKYAEVSYKLREKRWVSGRVKLDFTEGREGREELRTQEGLKQNWLLAPCRRSRQAGSSPADSITLIISPPWPHFCQLWDLCSFLYSQMPAPVLVWPRSGLAARPLASLPRLQGRVARTWSCCCGTRRCPCKKIDWPILIYNSYLK